MRIQNSKTLLRCEHVQTFHVRVATMEWFVVFVRYDCCYIEAVIGRLEKKFIGTSILNFCN